MRVYRRPARIQRRRFIPQGVAAAPAAVGAVPVKRHQARVRRPAAPPRRRVLLPLTVTPPVPGAGHVMVRMLRDVARMRRAMRRARRGIRWTVPESLLPPAPQEAVRTADLRGWNALAGADDGDSAVAGSARGGSAVAGSEAGVSAVAGSERGA